MQKRMQALRAYTALLALILVVGPAVFFLGYQPPYGIEFSSESLNHLAAPIWFVALWLAVALALRTDLRNRGTNGRVGYMVLKAVLALSFVGLASSIGLLLDSSGSHEVQVVDRDGYRLVLRWESCGATCAADLSLRQEWVLIPGLLRVRQLGYWSHAGEGAIRLIRSEPRTDSFEVHIAEWGSRRPVATDTVVVVAHSPWDRGPQSPR